MSSSRPSLNYQNRQAPSGSYTRILPARPQGVIRTMHAQRPSPITVRRRSLPVKDPFGPQIPLQISSAPRPPRPSRHIPNGPRQHGVNTTAPLSPVLGFLDSTFRTYAERLQTELTNLRTVCTKAVFREHQEKEKWRSHCITFKQERDIERERIRALLGERETQVVQITSGDEAGSSSSVRPANNSAQCVQKSTRQSLRGYEAAQRAKAMEKQPLSVSSTATAASPDDEDVLFDFSYPSPTFSPLTIMPSVLSSSSPSSTPSLPQRSRSADPVLSSTVQSDESSRKLPVYIKYSRPTPQLDMERQSPPSSSGSSTVVAESDPEDAPKKTNPGRPVDGKVDRAVPPIAPQQPIDLTHVDIMYQATNGKLECRVCLLSRSTSSTGAEPKPTAKSFPSNASWDELRDHCTKEHATECADLARLHPSELFELRRRLSQR